MIEQYQISARYCIHSSESHREPFSPIRFTIVDPDAKGGRVQLTSKHANPESRLTLHISVQDVGDQVLVSLLGGVWALDQARRDSKDPVGSRASISGTFEGSIRPVLHIFSFQAEDNEKFKTIVEFECRGLEPVDFQPQVSVSWKVCILGGRGGALWKEQNFDASLQNWYLLSSCLMLNTRLITSTGFLLGSHESFFISNEQKASKI